MTPGGVCPSNRRNLTIRDKHLLAAVGVIAAVGIALGIAWTYWLHADLLRHIARHDAVQWASALKKTLDVSQILESGLVPDEAEKGLEMAWPSGNVFRYQIYNSDGMIVAASRPEEVGQQASEPYFFDSVSKGIPHLTTKLNQTDGPYEHYAESLLPEMLGGVFKGAIKVYVDIGRHVEKFEQGFALATAGLVTLLLASASGAGIMILRNILAREDAQTQFRDAIETISEGFLMYDAEDRLVLCNTRFREMYSLASDLFVVGSRFEDILRVGVKRGQYPDSFGRVEQWIAERIEQHRHPGDPIERQLPDGRWVKIAETRTSSGFTVGIRTDITDLKIREQQLRKSEEQLRQIVESLQEGFVLYDAEDRLVMWNEKWLEIHKETRDLIKVGLSFEELARASVARKAFPEALGREEDFIAERITRHRNPGEPMIRQLHDGRWYIIREVPTAEGGRFAISIDITELKKAQTAAEEARSRAERADRAKSEFLANMSHELRTPLNAVIGFSDMIKRESETKIAAHRIPEYIDAIHKSGQHLLFLINDLLDYSKIEAGKLDLQEERVDLGKLLGEVTGQISQNAREAGVRLILPEPATLPAAKADVNRLRQILLNLLSNAIKFTPEGGEVEVSVAQCDDGALAISVRDTGMGMTEKDLQALGEPFRQFGRTYSRKHAGTGLGVSLARALAEMHGGRLDYVSAPGAGTTATLILPAERALPTADPNHAHRMTV